MSPDVSRIVPSEQLNADSDHHKAVLDTLRAILDSRHFSKSKRYPAFLEYVVTTALEGREDELKESILAAKVFSRSFGYDSANDSVVRVAAGEVRKRLAQYFNEHPDAAVRIELPVGSYTPEFHFAQPEANSPILEPLPLPEPGPESVIVKPMATEPQDLPAITHPPRKTASRARHLQLASLGILAGIACVALWWTRKPDPTQVFWRTFIPKGQQALILPGKVASYSPKFGSLPEQLGSKSSFYEGSAQPLEQVIVVAHICAVLHEYHHECNIYEASSEPLENLTGKPVVLVGGFNNVWTIKLLAPLPYRLEWDESGTRAIVERGTTGDAHKWVVQVDSSGSQAAVTDYILLARFHSDITDNQVLILAGLNRAATVSAGDFLTSPGNLAQLYTLAPKGWQGQNFEAILQTDVVSGSPGHPKIVAAKFW